MFTRYLGAVAVSLGVAGVAVAQQPAATLLRPKPSSAQIQQTTYLNTQPGFQTAAAPPAAGAPGVPGVPGAAPAATAIPGAPATTATPGALPNGTMPSYVYGNTGILPGATTPGGCPTGACPVDVCAPACDCLCGPPGRVWVSGEWIYAKTSGQNIPALVTSAAPGTPRSGAGALGNPGTTVLFGGQTVNNDWRNGFRINAGMWLDQCQRFGISGDFFYLQPSSQSLIASSDGSQILTRPFTNALTGQQDAQLVSFPGVLSGSVAAQAQSSFLGGGINLLCNLCCDPCGRLDFFAGYRYLNLRDDVTIYENLTAQAGSNVPAGTQFMITDHFKTTNQFNGPNVGLAYEKRWSHWYIGVRGSVAIGDTHTTTQINGSTTITPPGGVAQTYPGGLLTQPSNIGSYSSDRFSVVPEVGIRLGCQVTDHMRMFVGYNYLYWSGVARAGDQIDTRVNTNQIAPAQALNGAALPAYTPKTTGFGMNSISLGVEFRF
ncbi:BBP7 family outer membrane beta-barrel protein [Fimbriiglobus ruber]|uniref:BBP7 family outer membrane beta-barrel protein n=1 Tax=Fimbriiglobus ruber TaxID=1908690 RepID=A0A225E067_9BACT|nr:BBP7 family outer membrane beta-barrel protein [Fimbriiglobus ruber]OWK47140.1 hypothetical protein FRUB_00839 [Fimbriiglobus ruber]